MVSIASYTLPMQGFIESKTRKRWIIGLTIFEMVFTSSHHAGMSAHARHTTPIALLASGIAMYSSLRKSSLNAPLHTLNR